MTSTRRHRWSVALGSTLAAYSDGLIDTGLSRLPCEDKLSQQPPYQGSVETHRTLLQHGRGLLHALIDHPQILQDSTPTLYHPDLHKRNIFVSDDDTTTITDIIDWQTASIEPAFVYADETPDFGQPKIRNTSDDEPKKVNADSARRHLGSVRTSSNQRSELYGFSTRTFYDPFAIVTGRIETAL